MKNWIKPLIGSLIIWVIILVIIWVNDKEDNKKMIIGTNSAFGEGSNYGR